MSKPIDMTGQRFGLLTALERKEGGYWLCRCGCGREKEVFGSNLRCGLSRSCGVCQRKKLKPRNCHYCGKEFEPANAAQLYCSHQCSSLRKRINLKGQRFDRLTVLQRVEGERTSWLCLCDCGRETVVKTFNLVRGNTTSCGCKRGESLPVESHVPSIVKTCPICQNEFLGVIKQTYCSRSCNHRSRYPGRIFPCPVCGKKVKTVGPGSGHLVYCSRRCKDMAAGQRRAEIEVYQLREKLKEKNHGQ